MITIAQKLRPFSHQMGASCVIPGTCLILEAFPTLLRVDGEEIPLKIKGPVVDFTLQLDLEKGCIYLFGNAFDGYFKIKIFASDAAVHLVSEKGKALKSCEVRRQMLFVPNRPFERLSLGSHKSQDWSRAGLKEFLPTLFCLGQKIPRIPPQPLSGTAKLLEWPEDRLKLEEALFIFFKAAFTKILVPRLVDDEHQGLAPVEPAVGSPFYLIQEGAKQIRALFFKQNERRIAFLPHLPVSFDAGRMLQVEAPGIGEIDFEWTKKTLRRVMIRAKTTGEVILELPKEIQTLRVNRKKRQSATEPLLITEGKTFLLDQFKK